MKSNLIFLNLIFLIFSIGCNKEMITPITSPTTEIDCFWDCDTSKLNILWQEPIQEDTAKYSVRKIIHNNQQIYYGVYFTDKPKAPVYARNTNTGNEIWRWDDYHPRKAQYDPTEIAQTDNYVIVNAHHETQVIDKVTGINNWVYSTKEFGGTGNASVSIHKNDIFHLQNKDTGSSHKLESHLVKTNVEFPKWDTLYSFYSEDNMFVAVTGPEIWIAPNGDIILLMVLNNWTYDQIGDRTDLIAYNYTQRDTQFIIKGVFPGATPGKLTVKDNLAALTGSHSISCIDLISGEKNWEKFLVSPENFGTASPIIYDDKIINNSNERTYAFDLNSGGVRWQNSDLVGNDINIEHKGKLIGGSAKSGKLTMLDINSGTTILHEKSPNNSKYPDADYFWEGLSVDKDKGLIYASDGHFIQCIKLPF